MPEVNPAVPDAGRFDFDKLFAIPHGADLPNDGPASDKTDAALESRADSYQKADDLNWLVEGTSEPVVTEGGPAIPLSGGGSAVKPKGQPLQIGGADLPGLVGAAAMDIGGGAVEAPRQAVGGMRDAVQSIIDFGDVLDETLPLGGFQFTDKQGNFSPRYLGPEDFKKAQQAGMKDLALPEIGAPDTTTGQVVRSVSQFLTSFRLAGNAIGGLSGTTTAGTAARSMGAGAIADFLGFSGDQGNLANLVQSVPALQTPVTEFLEAKPEDTEAENRLKNAITGLGVGAAATAVFKGIKLVKSVRSAASGAKASERVATAFRMADEEKFIREAGEMNLIGRANDKAPLTVKASAAVSQTEMPRPFTTEDAARALTTRGLSPLDGAGDVYVNFARINAPEDIQRIIKDTSSAFSESIDTARRGVRTNADTLLSSKDIDAWNVLMTRRTGQPLNAEQSIAARSLWATAGEKLGEVAKIAAASPTPENLFQFRRMLATFHGIQKEVIGARTETARALQSWAMPVGGNLERMRDMTHMLQQSGGLEESADLARRFASLAGLNEGKLAVMSNFAEKTFPQKALGVVQEYWVNALLSNWKTHAVNISSNAAVSALTTMEHAIAARFGRLFSDESGVEIGEALAQLDGIRGGILDAFRMAGKAFVTGQTGYGIGKIEAPRQRYISSGTWNVRSNSWLGTGVDALGAVTNTPGKLLQAEDEFFKTIGYRKHIHGLATRTVQQELRSGALQPSEVAARRAEILDNPPEAIRMEAVAAAAYETFTSDPGKYTKLAQQVLSKAPVLKFILPFVNTPSNILKFSFERSPLAPFSSKYRAAIAEGGAAADLARTRMALGTMSLMYSIDLSLHGYTTGSGPTDNPTEMQNWRRQGNQPYSVKFGNEQIAYNRLDPFGYTLGIGADIGEWLANKEADEATTDDFERGFAASAFAVLENATSKSYLQGLAEFTAALNDPQKGAMPFVKRFAGSFVPSGVAEVARAMDPVQRESHNIVTEMKRRLPGFSKDLPPRRDLWGRPISYQSGIGAGYDIMSPLYGSSYKPEPIDKVMQDEGWFLGMGGYSFSIGGETVSLKDRPDIKSRFYELRGNTKPTDMGQTAKAERLIDKYGNKTLLQTLNEVVTSSHDLSEQYNELEPGDAREDFVNDIVRDYFYAAKDEVLIEFPDLIKMAEQKKAARAQ